jgi:hypothetical protein
MLVPTLSATSSRAASCDDSVLLAASDRSLCPKSWRGRDHSRRKRALPRRGCSEAHVKPRSWLHRQVQSLRRMFGFPVPHSDMPPATGERPQILRIEAQRMRGDQQPMAPTVVLQKEPTLLDDSNATGGLEHDLLRHLLTRPAGTSRPRFHRDLFSRKMRIRHNKPRPVQGSACGG